MPVDVIVGGQGGDEGKGKIAAYLSLHPGYDLCVRVSGPNAGHTTEYQGKRIGLATLPSGFVNPNARLLIGRGAFISVDRIKEEIENTAVDNKRLGIDNYATLVSEAQKQKERENENLMGGVGSVGTGLGPARIAKLKRPVKEELIEEWEKVRFAKDVPELQSYLADTVEELVKAQAEEKNILLEGDQGFKLSLIHGEYPFVTSRDTTASTFLGEAGLSPKSVNDVYIVFKPYMTRVGPGPLEKEVTEGTEWHHTTGGEFGTVSGRKRRIGEFEWENAMRAIKINGATKICITHMDYFGNIENEKLPEKAEEFLNEVEEKLCNAYPYPSLDLLSFGPKVEDVMHYLEEYK